MAESSSQSYGDGEEPIPKTRIPTGNPESLLELVCLKRWEQARECVEADVETLYSVSGNENHRLVIHQLCKLIALPVAHADSTGEISDDEDEEVGDERPPQACLDCAVNDNQHICEFATFMIEKSHALGPVRVSFPPEHAADADAEASDEQEEGRCEVHESILTVTDSLGKTPLHVLCENSVDTNMLRVLLSGTRQHNQNPCAPTALSLVTARDSRGSSPLHYLAYSRQCPISSLELMMDYCKTSAGDVSHLDPTICTDIDGDTPLHWALDGYMSPRRVKQLLLHSKEALRIKNSAGRLPFDQFATNFVDNDWKEHEITGKEAWDNIQAYLKVLQPESGDEGDDEWLPVHMLASCDIDFPSVFYDIALHFNKGDVSKLNSQGMLPLHLACARTCPDKSNPCDNMIASKLVNQYPQAAYKAAGNNKRLPIHLAVEAQKPLKLIAMLLKAYPNSLNVKDPITGLWLFLLAAVGNEETIDSSYSMLRADPSIIQITISALISKRGQRAAQALRDMDASELEVHSSRRMRRLVIGSEYDYGR